MTSDSLAAIIVNDLDSLVHRIEELPAHPYYTNALMAVQSAKQAMIKGRGEIHEHEMRGHFAKANAARA